MYKLVELNMNMGLEEYKMYQDIPLKESGSTNLCYGLPFDVFKNYLETQMARKYQSVSLYDTPTIIYIMYVDDIPVGYIGLRTEIDDNWKKWSGNIKFAILVTDSPCHGTKYHDLGKDKDNYPEGDRDERNIEDMIKFFAKENISLYCLKIENKTDKMFNIFKPRRKFRKQRKGS